MKLYVRRRHGRLKESLVVDKQGSGTETGNETNRYHVLVFFKAGVLPFIIKVEEHELHPMGT
jgi:hypothetical protein